MPFPNGKNSINYVSYLFSQLKADFTTIETKSRIENILFFNLAGGIVESYQPKLNSFEMNLGKLKSGGYFMVTKFENGETTVNKILKK